MNVAKMILVLSELGETPEAIRESLAKLGIKGKQTTCRACPIHNYLKSKMPGEELSGWYGDLEFKSDYLGYRKAVAQAAMDFIKHFDRGHYPELIDGAFPSNHAAKTKDDNAL